MAKAFQWIRSILFVIQMYIMLPVIGLIYLPWALVDRKGAYGGIHGYCRWVRWTAGWMIGLKTEIRGQIPTGEVIVASKHQSFLDIIMIASVLPQPKYIMKHSLRYTPVLGWYASRIGCVAVERGKRAEAMRKMVKDVKHGVMPGGQLVIYPQGTRVAPGVDAPYKVGTGVLYRETGQPCVPAATNVGVFWPRTGIYRKPGLAVVEFLDPIPPGASIDSMMTVLKDMVETRSDELMAEAGFVRSEG
ncbi:1-acyl-sn-glycerol-3-phosphate acyltransferase [Donghicola sp. C2-DW-16]|uniref:1-acyl-sn-glycerol-3-phosphate acyltransferase n=1 Tax=Donghicola mangrovi TaxID=2729614 RepID=A0A850PYC0_9RHOB|nr:lysophospholipid acyltransferase family protein [Donghicola mangrovi]NVO21833.1 1-acyl-sn-glycerol-3-phosphate acyltransferase [Donghicola mangrovi]NVO26578.1 1-acyl-sn-glycerol-3-phosphate acyltransferase [Donghicola mangrovi]